MLLLKSLPWLLLTLSLALGAVWEWRGRADQRVDIGAPLDDGYVLGFNGRERSADDASVTFRWSSPASELRLWGAAHGTPVAISLRMLAPPRSEGAHRVDLSAAGHILASSSLAPVWRSYRFLVHATDSQDLSIKLDSPRLRLGSDPRELGVVLDSVTLTQLSAPTTYGLLRELWSAPFLPLGLLLLGVCTLLLRLPRLFVGVLPAGALAGLALLDRALPDARLLLASYVVIGACIAAVALALARLARSVAWLWPIDDRRALRALGLIFALILAITYAPGIKSDGVQYYAYLRSLTLDGDLQFVNDYTASPFPHSPVIRSTGFTSTGHYINLASIGPAIAWSPLYGVAHALALVGQGLGLPWRADGFDEPYIVLSVFTSALAALVTMLAGYRICRRWVGPATATLAAASVLIGSNLLFYAMREGSFAHAVSAAAATLYVLAWVRLEEQPTVVRWAALGAAAGAMVLMYWISALVLVLPGLTFARLLVAALRAPPDQRGRQLAQLALGGAAAAVVLLLVFSPQMIAWNVIYGSFLTAPHGGDYIRPKSFQGLKLLFSHRYGLLPWTPAFFGGLVGLPLLWRRSRWLTISLALAFATYFGYNASITRWFAGGSFGLRRFTVLTPWFLIGLALLFDRLRRWRWNLPVALAALMGGWATLLLVRYDLYLIPHDPDELSNVPTLAFYLSRDTLPLWGLPGWLRSGYFWGQLNAQRSLAETGVVVAMILIMGIAIWLVIGAFQRLTSSHPARAR
jgi:hypothetical protein